MADDENPNPNLGLETQTQRAEELYRRLVGNTADLLGLGNIWRTAINHARGAPTGDLNDGWTSIGPRAVGGAVRSLVQDPAAPATFYAGTGGAGLWRSEDDGSTWHQLATGATPGDFGTLPVGSVAVSMDGQVLYAGTGEPHRNSVVGLGLFKSRDRGATWAQLPGAGGSAGSYTRLCVDPQNPDQCWVASGAGLFRFTRNTGTGVETGTLELAGAITDLALVVDPRNAADLLLLAGVQGVGVSQGLYTRAAATTAWRAIVLNTGSGNATNVGRVKVAIAPSNGNIAYALVEDLPPNGNGHAQPLYTCTDLAARTGDANPLPTFTQKRPGQANRNSPLPATGSAQAFYSLTLEVHPSQPTTLIGGYVDLFLSLDSGESWPHQIINWINNWKFAQRAEHGDMHSIVFDRRDLLSPTPRLWIGNDGGISYTDQWATQFNWRKRSYGLLAGQVVDVTSHPVFPALVGAGLQDNATFLTHGGLNWAQIAWADGGALVMDPVDVRRLIISWQSGLAEAKLAAPGRSDFKQPLPDVLPNDGTVPGAPETNFLTSVLEERGGGISDAAIFRALLLGDETHPNRFVVGRKGGAYYTDNGTSFEKLNTGAFTPTPGRTPEVGALALAPGSAGKEGIWVGTSSGDIFVPQPGGTAWTRVAPSPFASWAGQVWISGIAIHPTQPLVVAVSTYLATPRVALSHDGGATWFSADGVAQFAALAPVTCLAWHPTNEKVLFAGTLAGVFVTRNLPAYVAAPGTATSAAPTWSTFNRGLGEVLINDLEVVPHALTLRAGTFARGVYEASIVGDGGVNDYVTPAEYRIPAVKLSIRDHALDDGRTYQPGHGLNGDPRLPSAHEVSHLDGTHSIDLIVDSSDLEDRQRYLLSERFRHRPDGAELDEEFVCQKPIAGEQNVLYVQVTNRGWQPATDVDLMVFLADAGFAGVAPNLDTFGFPPAAGGGIPGTPTPWRLLERRTLAPAAGTERLIPGQPMVVRIEWTCPLELKDHVALLAICHSAADPFVPADVPSTGPALSFANRERRAALRILPVIQDRLFIRDGLDDRGKRGSVAWGGHSPDILVMPKAAADALVNVDDPVNGPFKNLNDARRADRVRPGDTAIFVRVHNRGSVAIDADVKLYKAPPEHITDAAWTQVGGEVSVLGIPPRGWKVARFDLAAADGGDPAPGKPAWAKAWFFAALARVLNPGDHAIVDPFPSTGDVTDVDAFWRFFGRGGDGNKAAFRTLRFEEATP